jgi:hypothetical protein
VLGLVDLLWFLLDLLASGLLDVLLDSIPSSQNPREVARWRLDRETFLALLVGLALGLLSGWVVPRRLFPTEYFRGTSIVFVPILVGLGMHGWGKLRARQGRRTSAVATWYGGGAFGLGLAAGRLFLLA